MQTNSLAYIYFQSLNKQYDQLFCCKYTFWAAVFEGVKHLPLEGFYRRLYPIFPYTTVIVSTE